MVLVQILITDTTNSQNYVVPISGKCSIRVLSVVYHSSEANTNSRVVQIRSDILQFPYSPMKWLTMISNPQATLNFDTAYQEYNVNNIILQGQLYLSAVQSDGTALPGTWRCLISLQIEKIGEDFQPMTNKTHPSR
jgi:hypothetical protein